MKGDGLGGVAASVLIWNSQGPGPFTPNTWTELTISGYTDNSPGNDASVRMLIRQNSLPGNLWSVMPIVYFDDIVITEA